jgi:predicted acyl esterase
MWHVQGGSNLIGGRLAAATTDTYDTIDWLIKNIPESNGKVGILGISYDGFTSLMALVNPHPAVRAAVRINAMVDGWRGDDWFHNGAFRLESLAYFHDQEATRCRWCAARQQRDSPSRPAARANRIDLRLTRALH